MTEISRSLQILVLRQLVRWLEFAFRFQDIKNLITYGCYEILGRGEIDWSFGNEIVFLFFTEYHSMQLDLCAHFVTFRGLSH